MYLKENNSNFSIPNLNCITHLSSLADYNYKTCHEFGSNLHNSAVVQITNRFKDVPFQKLISMSRYLIYKTSDSKMKNAFAFSLSV